MIANRTVPEWLDARVSATPDLPFIAMVGDAPITFGELHARSRRLANGLAARGVSFGDRVLVMLPNCVEYLEVWVAINRLGAVMVTVNIAYHGSFLEHLIGNSAARVMIVADTFLPALAGSHAALHDLATLVVLPLPSPSPALADARTTLGALTIAAYADLQDAPDHAPVTVAPQDIAAIIFTSGTTGKSKGVLLSHVQVGLNAQVYVDQLGITADDVLYCALPLFHTNALIMQALGALIAGCRIHVAPQFSASRWLDDLRTCGSTVTNLLGVMTDFVLKQPVTARDADNALRIANIVPIGPAADLFERRFDTQVVSLYGSTEANCPIYQPRAETRPDGSCGKAVDAIFECAIVDAATDVELPPDTVGELVVRPRVPGAVMAGYNRNPEATVEAWRNLWFHTGDAMRRDADGWFYFVDRIKDCIRRRAENISSFEVEQVVLEHDAVEEVAAVGIRSPFDETEQEVKVCVVKKAGAAVEAIELHAFCVARMPAFAVPRFIEFCDVLPRTPTQKIRKQALREAGITPDTWMAPDADGRKRRPA